MGRLIDISQKRFGAWVVTGSHPVRDGKSFSWLCRCDCGTEKLVEGSSLRDGESTNCGCSQVFRAGGKSKTPEYASWNAMRHRVIRDTDNKYYSKKGIEICERWSGKNGFLNFLSDMGKRPVGTTLDRRDSSGNYEPQNCRWATKEEQTRNRCNSRNVIFDGKQMPFSIAIEVMRREMIGSNALFSISRNAI